ncbi:Homeodomain-like protein, partial [Gigaspora rosea]
WTPEEDKLLADGVAKYGVGKWAQISKLFTYRDRHQVKNHWIDILYRNRGKWTSDEDNLLLKLVEKYVSKHGENWKIISEHFPNRSVYDIKMHYKRCSSINPKVNKGRWKSDEIKAFNEAFLKFGKKWRHIAEFVRTRTPSQC